MFVKPKILLLNIELELKSEKENAEIRLSNPSNTGGIVDSFANLVWEPADVQLESAQGEAAASAMMGGRGHGRGGRGIRRIEFIKKLLIA
ncbi:hypothetical protein MLD38_004125 [Melastoma candidum]|uniref:Uncharacterized protein n=1 Tax=Melastoma candidum TaxID=119954 RepID=A0ACB9SD88_9MYRT|nr:hypothetical protein MLD38_004125 [Melastoma candidum]